MMTEATRLDIVTGVYWETGITMMINRNREKTILKRKNFFIIVLHDMANTEMNDMQNKVNKLMIHGECNSF